MNLLLFSTLLLIGCAVEGNRLLDYHKQEFESGFRRVCGKYKFVNQYVEKLEHSNDQYLVFVYQEPGLKNGGLGDKIGGLVSAVAMALRFNRTLIVRSSNDMHDVFRPYHPTDIHNKIPVYSWERSKYLNWSRYNPNNENSDNTEYDLYDCINNVGSKNSHCSMKDGNARTPHILYRSNRAYLCYYDNQKGSVANVEMNQILGINETSNLYEAAGCMLRLALWPTELLWNEIGKELDRFNPILPLDYQTRDISNATKHGRRLRGQSRRLDKSSLVDKIVQVGMHFRCGDKSYLKKGGYDHMCVYDPDADEETKKSLFPLGNPFDMGLCARRSLQTAVDPLNEVGMVDILSSNAKNLSRLNKRLLTMGFIASDNLMSSLQMNSTLNLPLTIVSPQGCHVEMDPSKQCHLFTVTQWMLLALSDVMVTQEGMSSSFSRYAGIYGLKPDPFRNGKECETVISTQNYSRKQMSNWFC